MGPEAVNNVLKYEEDGDRGSCAKLRRTQLTAQPLRYATMICQNALLSERSSDNIRWLSVWVLEPPHK